MPGAPGGEHEPGRGRRLQAAGRVGKTACLYLSGVIGAGFVTGREVESYFGRFGCYGLAGAAVAALLFFVTACRLMKVIRRNGCGTMEETAAALLGKRAGRAAGIANAVFLYGMYVVILAGAEELLASVAGMSRVAAMLLVTAVCGLLLWGGFQRIALLCAASAPAVAAVMTAAALLFLPRDGSQAAGTAAMAVPSPAGRLLWPASAAIYVGYNLLLLIAVMPRVRYDGMSERAAEAGGLLGALAVSALLFTVLSALLLGGSAVRESSMPLAALAARGGGVFAAVLYAAVLITMILSAVTDLSGCAQFLGRRLHRSEFTVCLLLLPVSGVLSLAGFGFLMDLCYTFFGILGVILIFALVFGSK